ncbi:hypothetical protein E5288_WYG021015 [Bos mutus]|uniref:Uncharacterized protein n=1 Tax=Bos mutus TaxID=72004 RepID=A0A6B0SCT3_9CETA|nr:hypothetical protein [Bos mutus]
MWVVSNQKQRATQAFRHVGRVIQSQSEMERIWILERENPNTSEYCQLVAKLGHLVSEPYLYLQKPYLQKPEDSDMENSENFDMENSENFDMGFIQQSLVYLLCVYCIPSGML